MNINIDNLNKTILKCKKCPRLVDFIKKISKEKRRQNINEDYWGKMAIIGKGIQIILRV